MSSIRQGELINGFTVALEKLFDAEKFHYSLFIIFQFTRKSSLIPNSTFCFSPEVQVRFIFCLEMCLPFLFIFSFCSFKHFLINSSDLPIKTWDLDHVIT